MPTRESIAIESLLQVADKEGNDVEFKLNSAQRTVDDNWAPRMLIPKARQEGVSTYFLARNTIRVLGKRNTRAVVISHDSESTERMLLKVKYFLENMRGPKAVLKTSNRNELTFPKTNSMFYIGTAGSRKFGRGDTITDLHCSEVAYWPDPKTLMTGLLQAVPKRGGVISVESTGNGMGNWYHSACMRAAKGQSSFRLCFLPWWNFKEYTADVTLKQEKEIMEHLREDLEEPEMVKNYKLTAGQLLWRRIVIEDEMEGDVTQWKQEYPACLDDCFQATGSGFFQKVQFEETDLWMRASQQMYVLKGHPRAGFTYVLGADVAAGVGKDSSVMEIFCLDVGEQVGEWISNRIEPDVFAEHIATVGKEFNEAFVCVESNNHGILTLAALRGIGGLPPIYPMHKVYRTPSASANSRSPKDQVRRLANLGQRTTHVSKPYVLGLLRSTLRNEWTIHSTILKNEISSFMEHEDGSLAGAEGCHDDTVIAAAMARFVRDKAALSMSEQPIIEGERKESPAFTLESMVESIVARHQTMALPFPDTLIDPVFH